MTVPELASAAESISNDDDDGNDNGNDNDDDSDDDDDGHTIKVVRPYYSITRNNGYGSTTQ